MSEERKNELVPTGQTLPAVQGFPSPLNIFCPTDQLPTYWTTLDLKTPEGAWMAQEVTTGKTGSMDDYIGKTFTAVHVLCHPWTKTDDATGEVITGVRVILIGPAGETCSFTGASATRCIQRIASLPGIGYPPWLNGLPLEIGQQTVGGTKRIHTVKVPKAYFDAMARVAPKPRSQKV